MDPSSLIVGRIRKTISYPITPSFVIRNQGEGHMESEHAQLPLWDQKSLDEKVETLRKLVNDLYTYILLEPRQRIIKTLDEHIPFDDKERVDVKNIREAVANIPNIFNKDCEYGHLVASALVVNLSNGLYLLHHHEALGIILQFGGHAEFELDMADVAMREAREESGLEELFFFPDNSNPRPLDIDMHIIPSSKNRPEHFHLDFRYLLAIKDFHKLQTDPNAKKFIWLSYEEVVENK